MFMHDEETAPSCLFKKMGAYVRFAKFCACLRTRKKRPNVSFPCTVLFANVAHIRASCGVSMLRFTIYDGSGGDWQVLN